jgi:hypothetical protein
MTMREKEGLNGLDVIADTDRHTNPDTLWQLVKETFIFGGWALDSRN